MDTVRPDALAYLDGSDLRFDSLPAPGSWPGVPPTTRRLDRITGVGTGDQPAASGAPPLSEPLLAGLAGESIPFAFQVLGAPGGLSFSVGTWLPGQPDGDRLDRQQEVVTALVDGLFPAVDRAPERMVDLGAFPVAGIAHGVPRVDTDHDGPAPWDRILRSLPGAAFAVLVLAEPVSADTLETLRNLALEDSRASLAAEEPRPGPLSRLYAAQLDTVVASLSRALALGGWRVAVYLLGDRASYWRLSAAWRATFADAEGSILPIRTGFSELAGRAASMWAMPYAAAPSGPRAWQHPFLNQTLLNSRQLASLAHLPRIEAPGFAVRPAPVFAVSRPNPPSDEPKLSVGEIVAQRRRSGRPYAIGLRQLTRHAFVAGLTGSGKTNTVMHLLGQAAAGGAPFLVIEPAKTEYRALVHDPAVRQSLRIFTVGREAVSPLRLNPLEVPEGVDVGTHLDLLKAVFMGSFALWIPLPQVLEQCLVELYSERGWSFRGGGRGRATPTLSDLVAAVERVVPSLGYKGETTQEISASLTTRLNALRRGSRGLMLDVEHSIPMTELLAAPTVIELEGLGDDEDKAFLMGLLLTRLYEHRRAEQAGALAARAAAGQAAPDRVPLRHLVVVEEAHRLLGSEKKQTDSWTADPRAAFVSTFTQMLAEVRAYGQGMLIADQVPVRLAPEVLKNTNLKIAHRLVAGDDREAMAEAMSMSEAQSEQLAVLDVGRALLFSEGDHTPIVVQVPPAKDQGTHPAVDDAAVIAQMAGWRERWAGTRGCPLNCPDDDACTLGRELAGQSTGRLVATRLFHTAGEHVDGIDVVWPDVLSLVGSRTPYGVQLGPRVRSFVQHASHQLIARRSLQAGWDAADTARLEQLWSDLLAERLAAPSPWLGATPLRLTFVAALAEQQRRSHDPFPLCATICADGRCPYLHPLADVRTAPKHLAMSAQPSLAGVPAATALAADVVALGPSAPEGADTLNAARWRSVACAVQLAECAGDQPLDGAARAAAALTTAGWPIASP